MRSLTRPRLLAGLGLVLAALILAGALGLDRAASTQARPVPRAGTARRPSAGRHAVAVLGYQEEGSATALIGRDAPGLSSVGVDGTLLDAGGRGVAPTDPQALSQLRAAHAHGLGATLLVSNFSNAIDDFSEPLAHHLLANPVSINAAAATLARTVRAQSWQGITVDLESLTHRDEAGLTRLVRALRQTLPQGSELDVDIMNATTPGAYPANGYDLDALGTAASQLVLMGYDEYGDWENTPGPVGTLAWQTAGLRVLIRHVPADKLLLGVAGYGYAWEPHTNVQVSDARARAMAAAAGVRPRFLPRLGNWTATLPDGTVLWWADARSLAGDAVLARRLGLGGLAVWDLALSDPLR